MSNQRDNKISINDFSQTYRMAQQADKIHPNFFQNSKLLSTSDIISDSFSCLNSLFLRDNAQEQYNLPIFTKIHRRQSDNYSFLEDQSQVQQFTFGRGYSEEFQPEDKRIMIDSDKLYEGQLINGVMSTTIPQSLKISAQKGETTFGQSGQELQSNSINSQFNSNPESPQQSLCTGLMAKNVTKNISKLLFNYIWKNRLSMKKVVYADEVVWQKLMCMIRTCKKQNNVTRKFFLSRFHSNGEECRLFRVLAHHFFRKHCLAAIFLSKIKSKRIHFQRIRKFNQALTNVRALDYLA